MKDLLIAKIKSTNNGYIFAPTACDVETAEEYPYTFLVIHRPGNTFPYRISLK